MQIKSATVFGASGFLGRYVVRRLAADGVRIRAAVRDPEGAGFLKPMGDVGQVVPIQANVRHEGSVRRAVAGADVVINLVGLLYQGGPQRFDAVHVRGAHLIAKAAAEAGARRLLQVSAIGADAESESTYARTKAEGEAAARAAFPDVTIVRPSIVFGPEDDFFNRFGWLATLLPVLPLIGGGETRFQPVYVADVAEGMARLLGDDASKGAVYEFGGPTVYSFKELLEYILAVTGRKRLLLPLPFALAKLEAFFLQLLPKPLLTMDQVELLKVDNLPGGECPGLADLGVLPHTVEAIVPSYLYRYRRGGRLQPSRLG